MINPKIFEDMAKKMSEALPPGVAALKEDMEKNFKTIMQQSFAKLDLVPRDEFDVQLKVLARTREKVEALEERIQFLEAKLNVTTATATKAAASDSNTEDTEPEDHKE